MQQPRTKSMLSKPSVKYIPQQLPKPNAIEQERVRFMKQKEMYEADQKKKQLQQYFSSVDRIKIVQNAEMPIKTCSRNKDSPYSKICELSDRMGRQKNLITSIIHQQKCYQMQQQISLQVEQGASSAIQISSVEKVYNDKGEELATQKQIQNYLHHQHVAAQQAEYLRIEKEREDRKKVMLVEQLKQEQINLVLKTRYNETHERAVLQNKRRQELLLDYQELNQGHVSSTTPQQKIEDEQLQIEQDTDELHEIVINQTETSEQREIFTSSVNNQQIGVIGQPEDTIQTQIVSQDNALGNPRNSQNNVNETIESAELGSDNQQVENVFLETNSPVNQNQDLQDQTQRQENILPIPSALENSQQDTIPQQSSDVNGDNLQQDNDNQLCQNEREPGENNIPQTKTEHLNSEVNDTNGLQSQSDHLKRSNSSVAQDVVVSQDGQQIQLEINHETNQNETVSIIQISEENQQSIQPQLVQDEVLAQDNQKEVSNIAPVVNCQDV